LTIDKLHLVCYIGSAKEMPRPIALSLRSYCRHMERGSTTETLITGKRAVFPRRPMDTY